MAGQSRYRQHLLKCLNRQHWFDFDSVSTYDDTTNTDSYGEEQMKIDCGDMLEIFRRAKRIIHDKFPDGTIIKSGEKSLMFCFYKNLSTLSCPSYYSRYVTILFFEGTKLLRTEHLGQNDAQVITFETTSEPKYAIVYNTNGDYIDHNMAVDSPYTIINGDGFIDHIGYKNSFIRKPHGKFTSVAFRFFSQRGLISIDERLFSSIPSRILQNNGGISACYISKAIKSKHNLTSHNSSKTINVYYGGTIEDWFRIIPLDIYSAASDSFFRNGSKLFVGASINEQRRIENVGTEVSGVVTVPEDATTIASSSLYYLKSITEVRIPSTVQILYQGCFNTFSDTTITYLGTLVQYLKITTSSSDVSNLWQPAVSHYLFINGIKVEGELIIPQENTSIPGGAFSYCTGITGVNIHENVSTIGECAFYATDITGPISFENVSEIKRYAFANCVKLDYITIGENCICETSVFAKCTSLKEIRFKYTGIVDAPYLFVNSSTSKKLYYYGSLAQYLNNFLSSEYDIYCRCKDGIYVDCSDENPNGTLVSGDIVIPDSVTYLKSFAFAFQAINSITTNLVETLQSDSFYAIRNMNYVRISRKVVSIQDNAFNSCFPSKIYLDWLDDEILNYSSLWRGIFLTNRTEKIYIPQGQLSNYIAKGYPQARLIEE